MNTNLVWITPEAERHLAYIARVSNPANQDNENIEGLLKYMVRNQHWSPFEMVSACFEIETTRDIARQILRHRSFSFQEFSQRYQVVSELPPVEPREARLQDAKNRQSSIEVEDEDLQEWWDDAQEAVDILAKGVYEAALQKGIAKEVARAVLPEGLTPTRMYMSGTVRSWMHYCKLRMGNGTQKEHQEIATSISNQLAELLPVSWKVLMEN